MPAAVSTQTRTNAKDGSVMIVIPAGEFVRGSNNGDDNEKPERPVYLDEYAIQKYPVTVEQYATYCRETRQPMPQCPDWGWRPDHPVVNVDWHGAAAYAKWAGLALPTEAQWEKAARGTDGRAFPWGNKWDPDRLCHSVGRERSGTASVHTHEAGASPYGVVDMAGNVWEWCADWFQADYYATAPSKNPAGPDRGESRVVRGGGWVGNDGLSFRGACRSWVDPLLRNVSIGFRCVSVPG